MISRLTQLLKEQLSQEPPAPQGHGPWDYEEELARAHNEWDRARRACELLLSRELLLDHMRNHQQEGTDDPRN